MGSPWRARWLFPLATMACATVISALLQCLAVKGVLSKNDIEDVIATAKTYLEQGDFDECVVPTALEFVQVVAAGIAE